MCFIECKRGRNLDKYCAISFRLTLPFGDDFDIFIAVNKLNSTVPSITSEEMESRREIHAASRHSLRLEGLDGQLTPTDDAEAEAWVRGEITLEKAIENTLSRIRAGDLT